MRNRINILKNAIDEMRHAEECIRRVWFREGTYTVTRLRKIIIDDAVTKQRMNGHTAEEGAIKAYNDAIVLASWLRD